MIAEATKITRLFKERRLIEEKDVFGHKVSGTFNRAISQDW